MKALVVYDDTGRKSEVIADIIGSKGFSDVVVRRQTIENYHLTEFSKIFPDIKWIKLGSDFEYAKFTKELEFYNDNEYRVLLWFSNYLISVKETASLSIRKLNYVDETYAVMDGSKAVGAMFPNVSEYLAFCKEVLAGKKPWDIVRGLSESFEIEGVVDISNISNFIHCITGNFDSRYFNSLKENDYTLVKSSVNKKKILAEYTYYQLLPEDMKYWFVMPFNYTENDKEASYTMERLYMTDLAIKWVHGSMDESEFESLLDRYFYFFASRHSRECSKEEYDKHTRTLYVDKVNERVAALKALPEYSKIEAMLSASGEFTLDSLIERYLKVKEAVEKKCKYPCRLVIGHGDPCFSNALYNKSTKTLKFIDPKGAMSEEELWTHPYYDLAKLSHSICGKYDFFNNALYELKIDSDFKISLEIPAYNEHYEEIFMRKISENGFDYLSVRVYEASLFLSMLPLHIDNPRKVLGFIINANNIIKEIEESV